MGVYPPRKMLATPLCVDLCVIVSEESNIGPHRQRVHVYEITNEQIDRCLVYRSFICPFHWMFFAYFKDRDSWSMIINICTHLFSNASNDSFETLFLSIESPVVAVWVMFKVVSSEIEEIKRQDHQDESNRNSIGDLRSSWSGWYYNVLSL